MAGSRKPYPDELAMRIKVPRGIDGFWSIILDLDRAPGTWSVPDIDRRSNVSKATITGYVRRLLKAGVIELDRTEPSLKGSPQNFYRLVKKSQEPPLLTPDGKPKPRDAQWRLWSAMRGLRRGFTVRELAFNAGLDAIVPITTTRNYVRRLFHAGYLVRVGQVSRERDITYRLARDTGPKPPKILATRVIFDQNLGTLMGEPETEFAA